LSRCEPADRFSARWTLWLVWAAVVAASAAGLKNYRIDNDVARWTPDLAASDLSGGFVIVGFERGAVDINGITGRLEAAPGVAAVQPVAGDGSMDGLLVFPAGGTADTFLLHAVRTALGNDLNRVALAGPPVFRAALDDWSQRGLPQACGLILLIGVVVMGFTTRRLRPVVESLVAVFTSQIVLVGLVSWSGTPMDMVLSMAPPLSMGLGFSFAAHRATRRGVNRALLLSMATTAMALGLFYFTDFQPIRSFAIWGTAGIVVTWVAVMLLVSPTPKEQGACVVAPAKPMGQAIAWGIVAISAAVTAAGFSVLPWLTMQEDALAYFPRDARVVRDYRRIDAQLTGTLPFEIVTDRADTDPSSRISRTPGVRRFERIAVDPGTGTTTYLGLAGSDAVSRLAAAQDDWRAWGSIHDTALHWKGVAAQIDHIGRAVWRTASWGLFAMLAVAGVVAGYIDRRVSSVILSIWVNAFPVAILGLWLRISGHPLGLPTLLISALAVGLAIDDTLHLLLAKGELGSFHRAVTACRRPCVGSSVAMAACMLTFLLCPFHPTAEFGLFVAIAVMAALAGDLILLPATAQLFVRADTP